MAAWNIHFPATIRLHFSTTIDTGESGEVDEECALRAEAWCEYLESHAGRLYASAENPAVESARRLLAKIAGGEVTDGSTLREVYRRQWSGLTNSEEVTAAAEVLEDYGFLRVEAVKTGGRSAARVHLHPDLAESSRESA